jgi:putative glycosyl hydrolase
VSKALLGVLAAVLSAVAFTTPAASAQPHMLVGLLDESSALYGNPDKVYPVFKQLRAQVVRLDLYWGGPSYAIANHKPTDARDPEDPAYNWGLYDRAVNYASQYGIQLMFTVWGTPKWANGGKPPRYAPTKAADLRNFVYAVAERYSGTWLADDGRTLPKVRLWTAWNEPNQPFQLSPQYVKRGGKWIMQSAIDYAKICTAVFDGVHSTLLSGERVGCGVTAPLGNDNPGGARPVPTPMSFMLAVKKAGLKAAKFDAWAHNPYASSPNQTPTTPPNSRGAITLGNINVLIKQVTTLWGPKRIWLTEYGYQTNPPDKTFGVSYAKQSTYLSQAFAIARKNPRVDMMLWFLLKDEPQLGGWQSGLMTTNGRRKPAFTTFMRLPH